jgi:hypothetical protein
VGKQYWPAPFAKPAAKPAEEEDAVSSADWLTPGDVSASSELVAEIRRLLADKDWHSNGEQC